MRVLMITSEWPTPSHPEWVPFLVREVEALRQHDVQVDVYPFRGGMHPFNYMRAWQQVSRKLHHKGYDLVHAQFGQSGLLATFPRRQLVVVSYRGSDLNGIFINGKMTVAGWLLRKVSQLVALRADEIILVSADLARYLPRKRYHVIPSGLDMELFHPIDQSEARAKLNLAPDRQYVLFAGSRRNPIKRYALARAAVDRLATEQVELLVAEAVTPELMPYYMNAADVLLLTSSREGSPNVVKEALACNLPVVSVDVGDVRERMSSVEGCVVCENDRVDTIAAALRQVLQSGERVSGRDAVRHLDIRTTTQQIIGVYQKVLLGRPP
jgi:glycosyltransferase involved in cell wall biosynthesis